MSRAKTHKIMPPRWARALVVGPLGIRSKMTWYRDVKVAELESWSKRSRLTVIELSAQESKQWLFIRRDPSHKTWVKVAPTTEPRRTPFRTASLLKTISNKLCPKSPSLPKTKTAKESKEKAPKKKAPKEKVPWKRIKPWTPWDWKTRVVTDSGPSSKEKTDEGLSK